MKVYSRFIWKDLIFNESYVMFLIYIVELFVRMYKVFFVDILFVNNVRVNILIILINFEV